MTIKEFIDTHKTEIDMAIINILKLPDHELNDHERRNWIQNDQQLRAWAKSQGVVL